ncbi:sensor histidine kinase [Pontibacter fetidus]|uniref:Histidine kinase n=1 Tax=Pontibacter fetidus TaxID=2700082 RepID=A0A6B2H046_9BACT|nr:sensor histidine kinase [Pontibacter fetidus]NDK56455.1 histidine kinase [Pontibacter fetidus]
MPRTTPPAPAMPAKAQPDKKSGKKHIRKLLKQLAILLVASLVVMFIGCPQCFEFRLSRLLVSFGFSVAMFASLWQVNERLTNVLDAYMPWFNNPAKRLLVSIIGTIVVSGIVVILLNAIFLSIRGYSFQHFTQQDWQSMVIGPLVITFFISMFGHSRSFLLGWRQTAINAERLQKESIASQYESLKAQVNPHFLFNSLNALTSLVETDQKLAVKFIRKLSEVYRYVLDSRQKEVVSLTEELGFLESYIYLQKIRLGEALYLQNDLPQDNILMVVPLGLQMLVENAIKHNVALEEQPLRIQLYLQNEYIVVQNNLQERRTRDEDSTNTGLANLKARYSYLTDKPVLVQPTEREFIVKLPILHIKA